MKTFNQKNISDMPVSQLFKRWWNQHVPPQNELRSRTLVLTPSDLECDKWLKLKDILGEIYWRFWYRLR